jgi:hypothetical protein
MQSEFRSLLNHTTVIRLLPQATEDQMLCILRTLLSLNGRRGQFVVYAIEKNQQIVVRSEQPLTPTMRATCESEIADVVTQCGVG